MSRIAGLDIGEKTVGIAISDPMHLIAQGLMTYRRKDLETDLLNIIQILKENDVNFIVVGLPKNMNDSLGASSQRVMNFANRLRDKSGLEIYYQDERLTTVSANRVLIESKVRREKRKKYVDKIAATYILQTYLDRGSYG
ncbi:MAG: Holliday junction resolvase RuvX [Tissierellia bacterium]|nr:Holliday junction resolvase RuvX [Tissierellia bacterium]